jgi:hypothetical protein
VSFEEDRQMNLADFLTDAANRTPDWDIFLPAIW